MRLKRMKWIATGLLLLMAGFFVLTKIYATGYAWQPYVIAFTEAAMVGAMADWFAVTALFRHPLGIPIPHTAIVPRRKDEIGENLARFVEENFFTPSALRPRLQAIDFAARVADWLQSADNRKKIITDTTALISWITRLIDNEELRRYLREHLNLSLRQIKITPFIGRLLDLLTSGKHYQDLLDAIVTAAQSGLHENKHRIRDQIGKKSPWWIPRFVDKEIYNKVVTELETLLETVGQDSGHEARIRFNQTISDFIARMKSDPEIINRGEKIKNEILAQPAFNEYIAELWSDLSDVILRESRNPDSDFRRKLDANIDSMASQLHTDAKLRDEINGWLVDTVEYLITHYRHEIGNVISETVKTWDADTTAARVEVQVGSDLQFIRINGTIVGGLFGLLIYSISLAL